MRKREVSLVCLAVALGMFLPGSAGAGLVGWWKFDGNYEDSSGNGNHGTPVGAPTFETGQYGQAIRLNATASDQYVNCGANTGFTTTGDGGPAPGLTLSAWINLQTASGDMKICGNLAEGDWGAGHGFKWAIYNNRLELDMRDSVSRFFSRDIAPTGTAPTLAANRWYHVAFVFDDEADTLQEYVDGVAARLWTDVPRSLRASASEFRIGTDVPNHNPDRVYRGLLDDLRLYDEPLTVVQVQDAMQGLGPSTGRAGYPQPADKETDVARDAVLSWRPGEFAATHDVYLGTAFEDVNAADSDDPKGVLVGAGQDANFFDPAGALPFGQTYYWRVDEVNAAPDFTVFRGKVWSFTVEPEFYPVENVTATSSLASVAGTTPENMVNGSGLDGADLHSNADADMWLGNNAAGEDVWIQFEFDTTCCLGDMWVWNYNNLFEPAVGFGIKDVVIEYSTDGVTWTRLGDLHQFAQGLGAGGYAHNTVIPFGGVAARFVRLLPQSNWGGMMPQFGLSEVRFYYEPAQARQPQPADGAMGVSPDVTLRWRAGRQAASHNLYMNSSREVVEDGTSLADTLDENSYAPNALILGVMYYWRVDEVNTAAAVGTWEGPIWSLSVADYLVVDDFESYGNDSPDRIFQTWIDGAGFSPDEFFRDGNPGNGTGSLVGYDPALGKIMETAMVHGGAMCMPLEYHNTGGVTTSEATRTFEPARDWSRAEAQTLVLYFCGRPTNAGKLYVKINGTRIDHSGDAGDISRRRWNQWNVDLSAVPASALKSVSTLTIGVAGAGEGLLLIDDVRLYHSAPEIPVPFDPGAMGGLVASYTMSNNVQDSSGNGNHGTVVGAPTYEAGQPGFGTALRFYGSADCVDLGNKPVFNFAGSFSISLWANIANFSTIQWGHVMIANRGEDNVGWQIRRNNDLSTMAFTTRGVGNNDLGSRAPMPLNEWVHIACVYDNAGNTKRIYFNGVQDNVATTTAGAKVAATTHNTYIGARANSAKTGQEGFFDGMLDEIRIYDRALWADEVEYLADPTP